MMETTLGIKHKRVVPQVLLFALACGTFTLSGQAQVTLSDGNSSAQIAPNSQAGMFNWIVNGGNQLNQQWFWFALGNNAPQSIDTVSPALVTGVTPNMLTTTYGNVAFNVGITYILTGGGNGGLGIIQSDLGEQIRIANTSASPLDFHFYQVPAF